MSSMSYLLGPGASLVGNYVAHADTRRYQFSAFWYVEGGIVRWNAGVANDQGEHIGSPGGTIELRLLGGEDAEKWVRAAVELAIERMAGHAARVEPGKR